MKHHIAVIGSGFSSLSAACYCAKQGYSVTVIEKNSTLGGRARVWTEKGYTFDMGPSWYWMREVFDMFFADFNYKTSHFFHLHQLDPAFRMVHHVAERAYHDIPASLEDIYALVEQEELKSGNIHGRKHLEKILKDGQYTFEKAIHEYLQKKGASIIEFADISFIASVIQGGIFKQYGTVINSLFKNPYIRDLLHFPVLFLGARSSDIPYLYSMMAYTMLSGGTHYPMGGMYHIIDAMVSIAREYGVRFITDTEVISCQISQAHIQHLVLKHSPSHEHGTHTTKQGFIDTLDCDYVINGADYHHFEQHILPKQYRIYNETYWQSRVFAPSCVIAYLGLRTKLPHLLHHTLFFDTSLETHSDEIYTRPQWPSQPLFYACCPSKTDETVAPEGCENVFLLMPISAGLDTIDTTVDVNSQSAFYVQYMLSKIETFNDIEHIDQYIDVKRIYSITDFKQDYHAYKGNAYGLANTLFQTALFKPKLDNPRVKNLSNCGQLTVPGPGVPPSLISGKLAYTSAHEYFITT